jgi:hypothetical protein
LVLEAFGRQTHHRCDTCWNGGNPLVALEVIHRASRRILRVGRDKAKWAKKGTVTTKSSLVANAATFAAHRRLEALFPDLYAILRDEERVKRGLHPLARYNPVEFSEVVSKTLDFHDVYDALESSGVTDGP